LEAILFAILFVAPDNLTVSAVFHFLTSLFPSSVTLRKCTPADQIRQLYAKGLSLVKVAAQAGVSERVVRRVVGNVDREAKRQKQEEIARQIDGEALSWPEKVAGWTEQTGQSETTFWRALKRCRDSTPQAGQDRPP
jgi:hypothetical protein